MALIGFVVLVAVVVLTLLFRDRKPDGNVSQQWLNQEKQRRRRDP